MITAGVVLYLDVFVMPLICTCYRIFDLKNGIGKLQIAVIFTGVIAF